MFILFSSLFSPLALSGLGFFFVCFVFVVVVILLEGCGVEMKIDIIKV